MTYRYLIGALALMLPIASHAQLRVEQLKSPVDPKEAETYKVPLIVGTPSDVADRINLWLQYEQLDVIAGHYKKSPFEHEDGNSGTTSLDYSVLDQTPNTLSLEIGGEYMGAYPSSGHVRYVFDLNTGRPVRIGDLFSPEGMARFSKRVTRERIATINETIAQPDPTRTNEKDPEATDDLKMQREQYEECSQSLAQSGLDYDALVLADGHVKVLRGCGFPHVIQALDDIGEMEHSETYAALSHDLSSYGRCLLIDKKTDCKLPSNNVHAGVYRGKLGGRTPITLMLVSNYSNGYTSFYFYDRYGTPIGLELTQPSPGKVRLERRDDAAAKDAEGNAPVLETFDLTLGADGGLTGQWIQQGKPPMAVTLH
ncbi:hypothetical protein EC912_102755 [Luteibacter rhizovicinus]|uniref:Uncharacterized protein n=1 Tax=Luteibacter rhizovicinus TaxID=242606 RepID=A0A4R3YY47_9GAMM|nr:hypothetical protein [Luteibacter rhizovicinus]TCV96404.1 hypothetical protein EC912_102755 [Luteibacter rhizovicinus]